MCTDKEKADTLNAAFADVFSQEDIANIPSLTLTAHDTVPELADIDISPDSV